ncbi:MAG: threonine/serine exporter [Firmicutes bacterium HGW-Firmicutes-7]|nr:MAG: threonine/serine exporter [Firmicutes bacterium HGW-Firmicutes-7]
MIIEVLAAFVGTLAFSVFYNVSKRELLFCGTVGGISWTVYLFVNAFIHDSIFSCFFAAIVISVISHILSRVRKNPVTIYQIGGIFPLVPGAGMYKTLYYIVNEDYTLSTYYLYESLQIAGGIAVAMILIASLNNLLIKR